MARRGGIAEVEAAERELRSMFDEFAGRSMDVRVEDVGVSIMEGDFIRGVFAGDWVLGDVIVAISKGFDLASTCAGVTVSFVALSA